MCFRTHIHLIFSRSDNLARTLEYGKVARKLPV